MSAVVSSDKYRTIEYLTDDSVPVVELDDAICIPDNHIGAHRSYPAFKAALDMICQCVGGIIVMVPSIAESPQRPGRDESLDVHIPTNLGVPFCGFPCGSLPFGKKNAILMSRRSVNSWRRGQLESQVRAF